jgi:uncharacterized damage-inducible protein DinB
MTREELARLVAAHDAVWNGWWPVLTSLSNTEAQRTFVSSYPSVFATVAHMVVAEAFWQHRLDAGPLDTAAAAARDLVALERAWRTQEARRAGWLAVADPHADVSFTLAGGYSGTVKAWECVSHVTSHAHYHRGQVVTLLRQLGLPAPSLDLLGSFSGAV